MSTQTATLRARTNLTSTASSANSLPVQPKSEGRIKTYKDFLTPILHRRFAQALGLSIVVTYIEAILISPPSLLWFWNPISSTGARTFLLLISSLGVFIVRTANLHVGGRTTTSSAETAYQLATSFKAAHPNEGEVVSTAY